MAVRKADSAKALSLLTRGLEYEGLIPPYFEFYSGDNNSDAGGLCEIQAHGTPTDLAPTVASDVGAFLQSLSSAGKDCEARLTHRNQPKAKNWWRTRTDPFVAAWPVIEGWLIAELSIVAKALMERLVVMVRKRTGNTPPAAWLLVDSCPLNVGGHVCT